MKIDSGKLLIVAMLGAGVLAAAASWWFRYSATHQAARFWGYEAAALVREAPHVEVLTLEPADDAATDDTVEVAGATWKITHSQDVSRAPGLTHLRHALLEDRSFDWPERDIPAGVAWTRGLRFQSGPNPPLTILFTSDYQWMKSIPTGGAAPQTVSCAPIAKGLAEVFDDWTQPVSRTAESPAAADQR